MKISALEEYGLRCLVQLARDGAGPDSGATVATREIAEREGLTTEYASQIMGTLRKAGLVHSVRGANGGYRLAHPPERITVGRLFRVLDGPLAEGVCDTFTGNLDACAHSTGCGVAPIWTELSRRIYGFLDQISLADIAAHPSILGGRIMSTPTTGS